MKAQKHSSKKLSSAAIEGTIYYSIVYSTLPSLSNIFKNIRRIYIKFRTVPLSISYFSSKNKEIDFLK